MRQGIEFAGADSNVESKHSHAQALGRLCRNHDLVGPGQTKHQGSRAADQPEPYEALRLAHGSVDSYRTFHTTMHVQSGVAVMTLPIELVLTSILSILAREMPVRLLAFGRLTRRLAAE